MSQGAPLRESSLLGRTEELSLLERALESAHGGRGGLALVSGEAGIGKSALVDELSACAERLGFSISLGRAWEFADAPPWFALRGPLRSLGLDPQKLEPGGDESAFLLWEQVLEVLARTGRERPVLWIVEDVHAADLQTLDLLVFLTQPLRALRCLVVVTSRAEDPRLSDQMRDRLTRLSRDGLDVRLSPLSPELVEKLAERVSKARIAAPIARELREITGGNPLFVTEYARALSGSTDHRGALGSLPSTVRQVVLERARWLPEATQKTLAACSVVGRDFSAALVAKLVDALPARVIDDLLPALRGGIVLELEPGQFRFSHVLVRDAFYEAMAPGERASLHARAAAAFDTVDGGDALITAAQHALSGLPISDPKRTLELVERAVAAQRAQRAHDRAFALRRRSDRARAEGSLPAPTVRDLLDSVALARAAGRFAEARAICDKVLGRARIERDPGLLADAALALGAALQPGVVDATLVGALTEAQQALGDTEPALGCLVRARLAAALQPAPNPREPIEMALSAIADARRLGDPELLREVLFYAGSALVDLARPEERLECANELLQLAERTGDRARALHATIRLAMEHVTGGDFSAFSDDVDRALRLADELGHAPRHRWRPLLLSSMRASAAGRFDESERAMVEVRQLSAHCDDPALAMTLVAHQLLTLRLQRRDDEVKELFPEMQALMKGTPLGDPMKAMLTLGMSARREDEAEARSALTRVEPYIERFQQDPDFCAFVAEGVALVGSDELRRKVRTLMEAGAPELCMGHIVMVYDGPTRRVLALLDAALGETESALQLLKSALEAARARGHRVWVAQIEYDLGRILGGSGDPLAARLHLERAALLADELGIGPLGAAARARMGAAPAATEPATRQAPAELSLTQEGELWQVRYGERFFSIRDSRGMQLLARLIERPGEEIHALVLSGDDGTSLAETDAGEELDETAKHAYRRRLGELEREIDEAEAAADAGRLERLRSEREALVSELSRAVGLGGRVRRAGSATERARVNVRKRLKQAIGSIQEVDAGLGTYLSRAVRTGAFCCFRP